MRVVVATGLVCCLFAANGFAREPAPVSIREQELANGTKGLEAQFVVNAPPDVVLRTLWDVSKFRSIFPDIESLEVVARRGPDDIDVRFFVDATLKKVTYTLRRTRDGNARTIRWHSIAGDVEHIEGSWRVEPAGGVLGDAMSRVTYRSFVDVGGIVPTGLVRDLATRKVNSMAERIQKASAAALLETMPARAEPSTPPSNPPAP
jgi:ribosome-associated toxin RatA of RatAB toxin-antitoxin module